MEWQEHGTQPVSFFEWLGMVGGGGGGSGERFGSLGVLGSVMV